MSTLKLVALERPREDIPGALRALADRIDAGEVGEVVCMAVVLLGDRLHAYRAGSASDPASLYFVLSAAAQRVMDGALEEIEG